MGNKCCSDDFCSRKFKTSPLFEALIDNQPKRAKLWINNFLTTDSIENFDKMTTKWKDISINVLGLAFLLPQPSIFKHLIEKNSSLTTMDDLLSKAKISPIQYICWKNHGDILKLYLPHYLKLVENRASTEFNYTIDLSPSPILNYPSYYPIHILCKSGNIGLLKYIFDEVRALAHIPEEFDIETRNDDKGENCALIACREGNFDMMKFLNEYCNANFHVLNKDDKNAIMIAVESMYNDQNNEEYFRIIVYLTDIIKVPLDNYYDPLMIARNERLVQFLEKRLESKGSFYKNPVAAIRNRQLSSLEIDESKSVQNERLLNEENVYQSSSIKQLIRADENSLVNDSNYYEPASSFFSLLKGYTLKIT